MLLNSLVNKVRPNGDVVELPGDTFVKELLDANDRIPSSSRAGNYNGYVHVSSLVYNFCGRQYAIAAKEALPLFETVTGGHKVTWKIGRAVEEHVRDAFINQYGKEKIFAHWLCRDAEHRYDAGHQGYVGLWRPVECKCGKPIDKFAEPAIKDEANGVIGSPDLVFIYKGILHIIEIKSMKKDQWEELQEPLDTHLAQNSFYPYLLESSGKKVSYHVHYIYVTKDFQWGSPYKEFVVDMKEEKYVKNRNELLSEAKALKEGNTERICPGFNAPLAKKCPVQSRCFYVYGDTIE